MEKTKTEKELTKFLKKKAKELQSDWNDVPLWVIKAAAEFMETKQQEPETLLGEVISGSDLEYEDSQEIVKFLQAKEYDPNTPAQGYEIEVFKGYTIEIVMWEPLKHYTLGMLAKHIGV